MDYDRLVISGHAFRRMFERDIGEDDVIEVIHNGEVIESYPGDTPYPSFLLLGHTRKGPLHVVAAKDGPRGACYVVTAYIPDPAAWRADYRTRRKT